MRDGVSVNQFIASAAAEKMASVLTLDYLRTEAALGRREDFLAVLDSAPDAEPLPGDNLSREPVQASPVRPPRCDP